MLPEELEPGSKVMIERVDDDSWLVTRYRKQTKVKVLYLPVLSKLPDDPEWDRVEHAFTRAASKTVHRPDFD